MSELRVRARDLFKPIEVPTGEPLIIQVEQREGAVLEMEDVNFHYNSAVLLPDGSSDAETRPEQSRVTGLLVLVACYQQAQADTEAKLLVVGHTDPVGSAEFNLTLSDQRATNVLRALLGERDAWAKSSHERHVVRDYQAILMWAARTFGYDCDPGLIDGDYGPETSKALRRFQSQYNAEFEASLSVTGAINQPTWGAFFDLYELALLDLLHTDRTGLDQRRAAVKFLDPSKRSVGCGFFHPIDASRLKPSAAGPKTEPTAKFRSAHDRRVELLFFGAGQEPKLDCHPSKTVCHPALCEIHKAHAFEFEYLDVRPVTTLDFFARVPSAPALKPHNLIVTPGSAVDLHFSVVNADCIEVVGGTLTGKLEVVAAQPVLKSPQPTSGQVTVTVQDDTTYTLRAYDGELRTTHPQRVDVHLLQPGTDTPHEVVHGDDSVNTLQPPSQLERLARATFVPEGGDARLAGPATKAATPPQPPERTIAVPPVASAPHLLDFRSPAETTFMADIGTEAMRAIAVRTIRDLYGFGVSDLPKEYTDPKTKQKVGGRRAAYVDILCWDDEKKRASLSVASLTNSSCALVIRSLWRLLGARDFITDPPPTYKSGKMENGCLLGPPIHLDGNLIGRLLKFAKLCGAHHDMTQRSEQEKFDPQPGDVIFMARTVMKKGAAIADQHIFTVVRREGNVIYSIDGGQSAPTELPDGRPLKLPKPDSKSPPDGTCNGIWGARRQLDPEPTDRITVLGETKKQTQTMPLLGFGTHRRPILGWIELPKLTFAASVIETVKNAGNVPPGLPDEAVVPGYTPEVAVQPP